MTTDEATVSILERLSAIRAGAGVSLVVRHAEREEIQTGTFGYHVALTAQGISSAQQLGGGTVREEKHCRHSHRIQPGSQMRPDR